MYWIFGASILFLSPAFAYDVIDVAAPYQSKTEISLFSTHADSGYEDFPEVQEEIDKLIASTKAQNGSVFYIGKNSLMCSLAKEQVAANPERFPSIKWRGDLKNLNCGKHEPSREKVYPTDLDPTALVFESIGGEHTILASPTSVVSGGNFGGCAGYSAARILALWVLNESYDRHLWFAPAALYNSGCFDYSDDNATSDMHEKNRLKGREYSLATCLSRLEIDTDQKLAQYWKGYLRLWLLPLAAETGSVGTEKSLLEKFRFLFYRDNKQIGSVGEGSKDFHIHLGNPLKID